MAMIKCPECEKMISEYAEKCPNCGITMKKIKEIETTEKWCDEFFPEIEKYLNEYGALTSDEFKYVGSDISLSVLWKIIPKLIEKGKIKKTSKEHGMYNAVGDEITGELYYLASLKEEEAIEKRKKAPDVLDTFYKGRLREYNEEVRDRIIEFTAKYKVWNDIIKEKNKKIIFGEKRYLDEDSYLKIAIYRKDLEKRIIDKKIYYCEPNLSELDFENYKEICDNMANNIKMEQQKFQNNLNNFMQQTSNSGAKCPTCGSTNVSTISQTNRFLSVAFWGGASSNIGKTKKCNNCGYKW